MTIITHEPEVCEGYVWCDYEGAIYEAGDGDLSHGNGPAYPDTVKGEEGWTVRNAGEDYGNVELAFYECPGQHLPVFTVRPISERG